MAPGKIFLLVSFISLLILSSWYISQNNQKPNVSLEKNLKDEISYVAIGDSYTIGLGINENDRWPNVLTEHLRQQEISINLIANLAVSGYTVRDAIQLELPIVEKTKPNFVTILIGANDNFAKKEANEFRQELVELLDKLSPMLTNPKNIILITLPDYSKSPALNYSHTQDISKLIEEYNRTIKDEAIKRGLKVADIFPISQTMTGGEDYISDGIHPSAKGYIKWEKVIFPVALELLKK